jgi:hypothetical protein
MQMQIVIVPNPSATAEQLKELGEAIAMWLDKGEGDRYQLTAMNTGHLDLLKGELPQPLALEATHQRGRWTEDSIQLLAAEGLTLEEPRKIPEDVLARLTWETPPPPPGELARQRERLGELANLRCVRLSADGHGFTREEVICSMKEFVCDPGTDWNAR